MSKEKSVADTTTTNKKYQLAPNGLDADNAQLFQLTHMDAAIEIDSLKDLISKMHCFVYEILLICAIPLILLCLNLIKCNKSLIKWQISTIKNLISM